VKKFFGVLLILFAIFVAAVYLLPNAYMLITGVNLNTFDSVTNTISTVPLNASQRSALTISAIWQLALIAAAGFGARHLFKSKSGDSNK
jgi:uncharacterized membrane protein